MIKKNYGKTVPLLIGELLLEHPDLRKDIEILALEKCLINQKQMEEARLARRKTEQTGNTLVRLGHISRDDLDSLIEQERGGIQLGDLARKLNMISDTELKETLTGKKFQRTIGEIICDLDLISPVDLSLALKKYRKQLKIGEILLKQGVINARQYQEVIQEQIHSTDSLGRIMIDKGFISQEQLCAALSRQYNIPFKKLVGFQFNEKSKKDLIKTVGLKYAEKNLILPLGLKDKRIKLAVTNPAEILNNQDLLPLFSRFKIDLVLVTEENFHNLFRILYGKSIENLSGADEKKALQEDVDLVDIDLHQVDSKDGKANLYGVSDMEAKQVVDYIIKFGIINNASDIHIGQDRSGARLRYRLDGVLQNAQPEWLDKYVYNPGIKIITAEDPIEYNFPGIMQTQVKPKINLSFARLLRSFLRLDPDVIFVGEIRDEETARIAFDAAQTGHLLLSTIHTNDAIGSITRLLDLNIEQNQIASGLMVVAPDFGEGAMAIFTRKKNLRVIRIDNIHRLQQFVGQRCVEFKSLIDGGIVAQWSFVPTARSKEDLKPARCEYKGQTYEIDRHPTEKEYQDLLFGWMVEAGVTSNSVIYVKDLVTVGIGTGEQDRVGVAEIARDKAYRKLADRYCFEQHKIAYNELQYLEQTEEINARVDAEKGGLRHAAMVSDAFFPFRDGVDVGIAEDITSVIQPGESTNDYQSIDACNDAGVAMVYTGQRSFKH